MNPKAPEIIRGSFEAPKAPGAALTPEQKQSAALRESRNPKDPLAGLRRKDTAPSADLDPKKQVESIFGTPKAGTPEAKVADKALADAKDAKIIAENGLGGIVDKAGKPDIKRQNDIVDDLVAKVLDIRPQWASETTANKQAVIRELLKDEGGRKALAEALVTATEQSAEMTATQDALKTKREEWKTAIKEREKIRREVGKLKNKVTEIEKAIAEHKSGGKRYKEIVRLEGLDLATKMPALGKLIKVDYPDQAAQDIAIAEVTANSAKKPPAILSTELQQVKDYMDMRKNYDSLQALRAEKDGGLKKQLKEKKQKFEDAAKKRKNNSRAREDLKDEVHNLRQQRQEQQHEASDNISNVMAESINQFLDAELEARITTLNEQNEKQAVESGDQDDIRYAAERKKRWQTTEAPNGRPRQKYEKDKINTDWQEDLAGGDAVVDAKVAAMLKTGSTNTAEIDRRLTDPDYRKKKRDEYIADLISARSATAKIFPGEARLLDENGWKDAIDAAINADKRKKASVANITGQLGGDAGYVDKLKRQFGNNWFAILGLLLVGAVPLIGGAIDSSLDRREMGI